MPSTPIHEISDRYVDDAARLDPIGATFIGIPGHDDQLTDHSPDGVRARAENGAAALRAIKAEQPTDQSDTVAKAVFVERVEAELAVEAAGLTVADLNVIASPHWQTRAVFDLMPTETADDWAVIAKRLV